jgi:hypothetical protein
MKIYIYIIFTLVNFKFYAQDYTFVKTTETYVDLENPTSLNNGLTWSYPNYTIPIGFDFHFFNQYINTFYINELFDASILINSDEVNGNVAALVPFGANLMDRGYDINLSEPTDGSLSTLSYQTIGDIGSRIFKMEWNNVGFSGDIWDYEFMATDYANFQLWCYESSNIIELRFGESYFEHFSSSFYDETGPLIGLFPSINEDGPTQNGLILQGSALNPTMLNTMSTVFLNGTPPNGTVFKFTPTTANIQEENNQQLCKVYPNPTSDLFEIKEIENLQIGYIFDGYGRIVKEFKNKNISIKELESGIYFIKILDNQNRILTNKIIKN